MTTNVYHKGGDKTELNGSKRKPAIFKSEGGEFEVRDYGDWTEVYDNQSLERLQGVAQFGLKISSRDFFGKSYLEKRFERVIQDPEFIGFVRKER